MLPLRARGGNNFAVPEKSLLTARFWKKQERFDSNITNGNKAVLN
jgi:hypothetical protein